MASSSPDDCIMSIDKEEDKLHIAMFPWLAFGHIIPYLELAKLIAQKGHKVSFISTPRNIDRLPKLPPNLSPSIHFVKLPLPRFHNLPNGAESTTDLPPEKVPFLKKAHDLLQQPMAGFLEASKPDWLLSDFAAYWLPELSRSLGVKTAFLSIFIASCLGFIGAEIPDYRESPEDFTAPPRWVPFPSSVAYRKFEASRMFGDLTGDVDNLSVGFRFSKVLRGCDVVAVRSCYELEKNYLQLLSDILRKPVLPIGQLPPSPPPDDAADERDTWRTIKSWLDEQAKKKKPVVYVAFGSEIQRSQDELTEIALGLELSELPFIWVLRDQTGSQPVRLPAGFEERVRGRGLVCRSWVPQVKILGHGSVGVFLSHSGWSSVVEALQFSIPLVLLAGTNDQGLNARLLEEEMIGYPVPRDEDDGSFTRDSVAESLRLVAERDEGKVYREKAMEMSAMFGDRRLQDKYVDEFLGLLIKTRGNKEINGKDECEEQENY